MRKGFTLIELLAVIAIISILAGAVILTSVKGAAQARDARRIQEIYQIAHSLEMYYSENGFYPDNADSGDAGCSGNWDAGSILNPTDDTFIKQLKDEGYLSLSPIEKNPIGISDWEKCSYRYQKAENPCGGCSGTYAVLYAVCETNVCPKSERPACCSDDNEGGPTWDAKDIAVFLKEK